MKKVKIQNLLPLLTIAILLKPVNTLADICQEVADQFYFAEKSSVETSYFEKYLLGKKKDVYYIHAIKTTKTEFNKLVQLFQDLDSYPEFMLGYKDIKVRHLSETDKLTSIKFDPPLSPFTSQFTNEVQAIIEQDSYQQCWRQLAENDKRLEEKNNNAPILNKGYWRLNNLGKEGTRISYHIAIEPPISMPLFLYRMIVKDSYEEIFDRIIKRADSLSVQQ